MQDRLDRLERDLSMLQRQVYRGGPAQVVSAGSAARGRCRAAHGSAGSTDARTDRARRGRGERGRAAAAPYRADQQRHRPAVQPRPGASRRSAPSNSHAAIRRYRRFQPRGTARDARSLPGSQPALEHGRRTVAPELDAAGPPGPPPRDPAAGSRHPDASRATCPADPSQRMSRPPGNLRPSSTEAIAGRFCLRTVQRGIRAVKQADYPAAEEALKTFIAQHPKDPLAGSAQYWLGETYYARGQICGGGQRFCRGLQELSEGDKGGRRSVEARHVARPRQPKAERLRRVGAARSRLPQPGKRDQGARGRREEAAGLLTGGSPARPLTPGEFSRLARLARPFRNPAVSRRRRLRRSRQLGARHSGGPLGAREGRADLCADAWITGCGRKAATKSCRLASLAVGERNSP